MSHLRGSVHTVTIAGVTGGVGTGVGVIVGGAVAGGFGQLIDNDCEGEPREKDILLQICLGALGAGAGVGIGKGGEIAGGIIPK